MPLFIRVKKAGAVLMNLVAVLNPSLALLEKLIAVHKLWSWFTWYRLRERSDMRGLTGGSSPHLNSVKWDDDISMILFVPQLTATSLAPNKTVDEMLDVAHEPWFGNLVVIKTDERGMSHRDCAPADLGSANNCVMCIIRTVLETKKVDDDDIAMLLRDLPGNATAYTPKFGNTKDSLGSEIGEIDGQHLGDAEQWRETRRLQEQVAELEQRLLKVEATPNFHQRLPERPDNDIHSVNSITTQSRQAWHKQLNVRKFITAASLNTLMNPTALASASAAINIASNALMNPFDDHYAKGRGEGPGRPALRKKNPGVIRISQIWIRTPLNYTYQVSKVKIHFSSK
ncbi:hypothetical protein FB451DRAFT_1185459 [Mycena latifolia]|nr:hypothetical protein FB451DRAFT_1185459 [Mycena latifolia]